MYKTLIVFVVDTAFQRPFLSLKKCFFGQFSRISMVSLSSESCLLKFVNFVNVAFSMKYIWIKKMHGMCIVGQVLWCVKFLILMQVR